MNISDIKVNASDMLEFLQEHYNEAISLRNDFGADDSRARMHISWCIGMKEMCEALIGVPVNLRRDGMVTIGL